MAAEGLRNDRIAVRLDTTRQAVSKWCKRFHEQRLAGLDDLPRVGRPPDVPPDVVVATKALACELPATSGVPLARLSRRRGRRLAGEDASASDGGSSSSGREEPGVDGS
jgi:transposase